MSCSNVSAVLQDPNVSAEFCGMAGIIPTVIKGESITLNVTLSQGADPFALTGASASGFFGNTDQSVLGVAATIVSADLGSLSIPITKVQSAALLSGDQLDFEIVVDKGGSRTIVQDGLTWTVLERRFATGY